MQLALLLSLVLFAVVLTGVVFYLKDRRAEKPR